MIQSSLKEQLNVLCELLSQLSDEQYTCKVSMLSNASIGQHVRHIVELVQCLVLGYEKGLVDYDRRKRDKRIETGRTFALQILEDLQCSIDKPEKDLLLHAVAGSGEYTIETGFSREILYNTEHAIHHMALIRVALMEMRLDIVNDTFGVAYATTQYQNGVLHDA